MALAGSFVVIIAFERLLYWLAFFLFVLMTCPRSMYHH
jgi:hypothetical protein